MNLPRAITARRVEREADIEAQGAHRRGVSDAETRRKLQIADGQIEGLHRDLAEVHKDSAAELAVEVPAQFQGSFDQAAPADRIVGCRERSEFAALVAAHTVAAARVETFEERDVLIAVERLCKPES